MAVASYSTIDVRFEETICFLRLARDRDNNTIDAQLVRECALAFEECEARATVVVISGSPEVFCYGADFKALVASDAASVEQVDPAALYDIWLRLTTGSYVTVAHVRGKVNAGGVGFVAACDLALSDETSQFSLSEMLFGLYPACVLPFLIRRVGFQRAHYLTLTTQPVNAAQAKEWGLVDAVDVSGENLLRRNLLRLRRWSKPSIRRYKDYMAKMYQQLPQQRDIAVQANRDLFCDSGNLSAIRRYVEHGVFPWE